MVFFMMMDYENFKKQVLQLTKIDLNAYKERQMKRRIDSLISKNGYKGYEDYIEALRKDQERFEEFVTYLTINVSEFYRNPEQWDLMDKVIIPELISKYGKNLKIHITATDLDKQVIAKAKVGLYSEKSIASVPADLKKKYFTKVGPSYQISDEIKSKVEFKEHNLLDNNYATGYHMIVCRNVLIYFTEEAKDEVFRKFFASLAPGGILFIGSTEQIITYKEMGYERKNSFYYEKPKK